MSDGSKAANRSGLIKRQFEMKQKRMVIIKLIKGARFEQQVLATNKILWSKSDCASWIECRKLTAQIRKDEVTSSLNASFF